MRPTWASPAVSHLCACIGSPCLRHCVHGASIGDDDSQSHSGLAAPGGWRQPRKEPLLHFGLILAETGHVMGFRGPPGGFSGSTSVT
eukprot:COSAG01_NODE_2405_length_7756_cov_2.156589_2_plen_87_part_00